MSTLRVSSDSADLRRLEREFDSLSTAQQRLIVGGSAVGRQFDKTAKQAKGMGSAGASAFRDVVAGVTAVMAPMALLHKGIDLAKQKFAEMRDRQREALTAAQGVGGGIGEQLLNDPLLRQDPALFRRFEGLALDLGSNLGAGGAARVASGIASLRSRTAGFSEDEREAALREAVNQARLGGESVDIGLVGAGIARVAGALRRQGTQREQALRMAGAMVREGGGQFAGAAEEMAGQLPGIMAATEFGTTVPEALGIFAGISGTAGVSAAKTKSSLMRILGRLARGEAKVDGQAVQFQAEGGGQRLLEFLDRFRAGEFGEGGEAKARAASALGERAADVAFILGQGPAKLRAGIARVQQAAGGADPTQRDIDFLRRESAAGRRRLEEMERTGQAEVAGILDVGGGRAAGVREDVTAARKRLGLTNVRPFAAAAMGANELLASPDVAARGRELDLIHQVEAEIRARAHGRGRAAFGVGVQAFYGGVEAAPVDESMGETVARYLRQGARTEGAIDLRDGIDRLEAAMLQQAGVTRDAIAAYENARERKDDELVDRMAEQIGKALTEFRRAAPGSTEVE